MPVSFGYYPEEGSRVVTAQYDWATVTSFNEDCSQLVAKGIETSIQSAYIDNSNNPNFVSLLVGGSLHLIIITAFSQGIVPLFFTGTPNFQVYVNSVANATTRLYLLNVPCGGAQVWPANSAVAAAVLSATPVSSLMGITATTLIKPTPGRLFSIVVEVVTAVAAITINDAPNVGTITAANTLLTIPVATPVGTIYQLNWPCFLGIAANFAGGATGSLSASFA
jgi:hypothetical protein